MQFYVSPNRAARHEKKTPDLIVIHATVGSWESALSWMLNHHSRVSAHYLIGKQGRIARLVPEQEEAWHAGLSSWPGFPSHRSSLNWRSIGIELENANDGKDPYTEYQIGTCAGLVSRLSREHGIPLSRQRVVGHWEISPGRKTDPRGFDLDELVQRAAALNYGGLTILAAPRIPETAFIEVLLRHNSPAAPYAQALYRICIEQQVDPAVALAFFYHESSLGKAGLCKEYDLKNWGNVRTPEDPDLRKSIQIPGRGPFCRYPTWEAGLLDWCKRMKGPKYAGSGLHTVEAVVPKYAPSSDGNAPARYIEAVRSLVERWQGTGVVTQPKPWEVVITADVLNIRQGPGMRYPIVGKLRKGERVLVGGIQDEGEGLWLWLADQRGVISGRYTTRG